MTNFFTHIFKSRLLFAFTLLFIVYGLFFVADDKLSTRTWTEIWNLGHIAAFTVIWLFNFNIFPVFRRLSTSKLILFVGVSTLVAGESIELLQGLIGRDNEWQDVWDSEVGALLAICFFSPQIRNLITAQQMVWRVFAVIMLVVVPWSIWSALADEVYIRQQFPILSDFTTPFELSRWHANTAAIHTQKKDESQLPFLDIDFHPATYSTVSLMHFYRDWRGYKQLVLEVTNPEETDLKVILRIHDQLHRRHAYALKDRFNLPLLIKPGRQSITIALDDVKNAPRTRKMGMQHIEDLSIFTMQSKAYHRLYIHKIMLE